MNTVPMSVYFLLLLTAANFAELEPAPGEKQVALNGPLLLNHVPPQNASSHLEDVQMCTDKSPSFTYDVKPENQFIEAHDCSVFLNHGRTRNGVYIIRPKGFPEPFHVYCDMEMDGGGWTVIQRRGTYGTPDDYFDRNWDDYKRGFGDLTGEFWLGNDKISALTNQGKYRLKMDLFLRDWSFVELTYRTFKVGSELEMYKLTVGEFSTPGQRDDMSYNNGQRFTTKDRNNDRTSTNCAAYFKGAWWYYNCSYIYLNGLRSLDDTKNRITFGNNVLQLRHTVMKIRLDDF